MATLVIVAGIIVLAVGMKMTIHDLGAEGKHRSDERWSASGHGSLERRAGTYSRMRPRSRKPTAA